jgi:hypothetical protein
MTRSGLTLVVFVAAALATACGPSSSPETVSQGESRELKLPDAFVDRVWEVSSSASVAPGTLYVFLSEGTLVIASPNSKPALGTWEFENEKLTMIEESIPYQVDILSLNEHELTIRSNNPGSPVEIRLHLAKEHP